MQQLVGRAAITSDLHLTIAKYVYESTAWTSTAVVPLSYPRGLRSPLDCLCCVGQPHRRGLYLKHGVCSMIGGYLAAGSVRMIVLGLTCEVEKLIVFGGIGCFVCGVFFFSLGGGGW